MAGLRSMTHATLAVTVLGLALAGCGQRPVTTTRAVAPGQALVAKGTLRPVGDTTEIQPSYVGETRKLVADGDDRITPEGAEGAARSRAKEWNKDIDLRFVGWGVVKWELVSAVSHVFYSKSSNQICVVSTAIHTSLQDFRAFAHPYAVTPATTLLPLERYKIEGSQALKIGHSHMNGTPNVSLVVLAKIPKIKIAAWGILGDTGAAVIDASSGAAIGTGDFIKSFPKEWTKK